MTDGLAYPKAGSRIRVYLKPYNLAWMNQYPPPAPEGVVQATRDKTAVILTHTKSGYSPYIAWERIARIDYLDEDGSVKGSASATEAHGDTEEEQVQTWEVQGSKGKTYVVTRKDDQWSCTCVAGSFGKSCKHVQAKKEEISI